MASPATSGSTATLWDRFPETQHPERRAVLFGPMRHALAADKEDKMSFWSRVIQYVAKQDLSLAFGRLSLSKLQELLQLPDGMLPMSLQDILAIASAETSPEAWLLKASALHDCLDPLLNPSPETNTQSSGWLGGSLTWLKQTTATVLFGSPTKAVAGSPLRSPRPAAPKSSANTPSKAPSTNYVVLAAIKPIAELVEDKLSSESAGDDSIDSLFVLDEILQNVELVAAVQKHLAGLAAPLSLTKDALTLAVGFLVFSGRGLLVSRQRESTADSAKERMIVGFKLGPTHSAHDGNILLIKHAHFVLHTQVLHLLDQINKLDVGIRAIMGDVTEAKDLKRKKAAPLLKKKHLLEAKHEQRSKHLDNIRNILDSVDSSLTQQAVVKMLDTARTTLRQVNVAAPKQEDAVHEIFDELEELMDEQKQIDDIIADRNAAMAQGAEDEADLEKELDSLIAEQQEQARKAAQPVASAPALPVPQKSEISDEDLIRELEGLTLEDFPPVSKAPVLASQPAQ